MKHGDLSNRQAPVIAFDLDSLLWEDKNVEELSLAEKVKYKLTKKLPQKINKKI